MAVHIVRHPLVQHKLGLLRMASTGTREFRTLSNEIAGLLIYEATQRLATETRTVQGWAGPVEVEAISGKKVTVVPILRAGLGLMDGVLDMIPGAKISVVGLYRNEETLEPSLTSVEPQAYVVRHQEAADGRQGQPQETLKVGVPRHARRGIERKHKRDGGKGNRRPPCGFVFFMHLPEYESAAEEERSHNLAVSALYQVGHPEALARFPCP